MLSIIRFLLILLLALPLSLSGQTSQIRGTLLDQQSEMPLIGATVRLIQPEGVQPLGGVTDTEGRFLLKGVPVGRQAIQITYTGYDPLTVPNVLVTSGKEVQLTLKMQESLTAMSEVTITAKVEKDRPVNELAPVSVRQFNVEEVQRYSGGRNDVARMAANFAGVAASNDSRNDIVIRGNSPAGVLWRLEGIPIPNPNHFSTLGTTGGPVSALNTNMIANSDFMTGAFSAEYGNALAGVFDVNMRTGNRDRFEATAQLAAFSGLEAMIEGPLSSAKKGSFAVSYRHSFVELADNAGLDIGATPRYKDLTFNVDFGPSKIGKFSIFGIGGVSAIDFLAEEATEGTSLFVNPNQNSYNTSDFGVAGLKHNLILNDHSYLRTIVSVSYAATTFQSEDLSILADGAPFDLVDVSDKGLTYRLSTMYNNKINRRWLLRAGALLQRQGLETSVVSRENTPDFDGDGTPDWITYRDFDGEFDMAEAYVQNQFRLGKSLTFNAGLHGLYFDHTEDLAVEPRAAFNWQVAPKSAFTLGYGLHHQNQPLPVFLLKERQPDGSYINTNGELDFTRSHHLVLAYDYKPAADWRVKAELYHQWLSRVPVEKTASSFSMINAGANFVFPQVGSLSNAGEGRNYGLELTAEKFFSKGWYALVTASLFRSYYTGSDDIERSTFFDGKYVFNALTGREWSIGKSGLRFITFDTKLTLAGGRPYTPVNLEASIAANEEVLDESRAYSLRLDDYFRWDVKVGYRLNSRKRKFSQTFFLDFQNVTNHANIFAMQYNTVRKEIGRVDQIGFFPDVLWRMEF